MTQSASENALQTQRKRRRTPKSCHECRRCKTRCDRNEPCSHCLLSKTPCVYSARPTQGNAALEIATRSASAADSGTPPTTSTSPEVLRTPAPSTVPGHHGAPHLLGERLGLNKSRLFGQSHWTNTAALEVSLARNTLRSSMAADRASSEE